MRVFAIALAGLAMGGCATLYGEEPVAGDQDARYQCDASKVQSMVGQTASQALGTEAVRAAGARTMRWLTPGSAYTMDYRTDRLNIHLDANNRVTKIDCG